jgi:hypothetical protein
VLEQKNVRLRPRVAHYLMLSFLNNSALY